MKKLFFPLLTLVALSAAAQDSTLKEYVGKYNFQEGSIVPSAEVYLKDGGLVVNSVQGSSDMEKLGRDTFALIAFDGMAYFTRNSSGQVSGVKVEVGEYRLTGIKENVLTTLHRRRYVEAALAPRVR